MVRAPPSHGGGHKFESYRTRHFIKHFYGGFPIIQGEFDMALTQQVSFFGAGLVKYSRNWLIYFLVCGDFDYSSHYMEARPSNLLRNTPSNSLNCHG
jgi:hypothetical protein